MGQRDRVLFIQPPTSFNQTSPCLDDKQFGLGLLANAAWLEAHGFEVRGLHIPLALHYGFEKEDVKAFILKEDPIVIAIGLNWVHFSSGALEVARLVKTLLPHIPVYIGGQHATLFAEEIACTNAPYVDGVIKGEAEHALLSICQQVAQSGKVTEDVSGLVTSSGDSGAPQVLEDMDDLPVYRYSVLKPRSLRPDAGAISTTRGACPFKCAWCIEPVIGRLQGRRKLMFHSAKRIVDQIEALMSEGITRFTIQDNFFVGGNVKLIELSEQLVLRDIRPDHLNIFAHPESYGYEGYAALAACCELASVDFGVETGSYDVAQINNRHLDHEEVVLSISEAVRAKVEPFTWWMAGLPGEDEAALRDTEQLILETMKVGGIPRWVSPMILFPHTPIHEDPVHFGVEPRFRDFEDYSRFSQATLAEAVLFSDTITHKNTGSSYEDICNASQRLRKFIAQNLHLVEEFYETSGMHPDLKSVESRILQSFF